MKYYVIINGESSLDIQGLAIESLPAISKPLMRSKREEIDGRNGDIITQLGFSAYDKTLKIGLWGNYDIDEIISYFNQDGIITFSNEPDMYYNFTILNRIDFINQLEAFRKATITIHCQPFKYKEEETETLELEEHQEEGTSFNLEGTYEAPMQIDLKGNTSQVQLSGKNLAQRIDGLWFNGNTFKYYEQTQGYGFKAQIKPNTTYTISKKNASNRFAVCIGSNDVVIGNTFEAILIQESDTSRTTYTFTSGSTDAWVWFGVYRGTTQSEIDSAIEEVQIEEGSTPTTYEQYCGGTPSPNPSYPQDINVVSGNNNVVVCGKNLFNPVYEVATQYDKDGNVLSTNRYILNNDTITIDKSNYSIGRTFFNKLYLTAGTYTWSLNVSQSGNTTTLARITIKNWTDNTDILSTGTDISSGTYTYTFTINEDKTISLMIVPNQNSDGTLSLTNIQLEKNNNKTTYEAYQSQTYPINLGSIELCKIGDYKDSFVYDNNKWYLHKEIGKVVFNGTEAGWVRYYNETRAGGFYINISSAFDKSNGFCDEFIVDNSHTSWDGAINTLRISSSLNACFKTSNAGTEPITLDQWKSNLSSNNLILYYQLATATNTEITDTTLIEQLNAIKDATSYTGTTNILQDNNDMPFILDIDYFTGTNEITITNNGNTYSKPVLTLVGSGVIGIYLNDSQIFQVALGTNETIIIDTDKMEAYYESTLKNRQVIGDYNSFKLLSGENTIRISGTFSKLQVDNYSRWI